MMKKILMAASFLFLLSAFITPVSAATWMIGDNDGYGMGIVDNANHPFNGTTAAYDGRSQVEINATNGAQYTDTYSTTHGIYGPQLGTVATFLFTGLGNSWTAGSMWFDMADFQASTFGAVTVTFNGFNQNWGFNDGFPTTKIRYFDLSQEVISSINSSSSLTILIDRNGSSDFYGFDYAMLSSDFAVPEPATVALFGLGLLSLAGVSRKKQ